MVLILLLILILIPPYYSFISCNKWNRPENDRATAAAAPQEPPRVAVVLECTYVVAQVSHSGQQQLKQLVIPRPAQENSVNVNETLTPPLVSFVVSIITTVLRT